MAFNPTYNNVQYEGADLAYWYQGSGPLLILIPGGGGHGAQFGAILPYLSRKYTTVAYDRRQNLRSIVEHPKQLNPVQQARDIIAIAKHMGYEKTSLFGNSGGGIIALQLAASYPQHIEHVIVHEAPTTSLLPDATKYMD